MHNLVIELKRPTQKITPKVLQEVRAYAFAIAKDERFAGVPAKWTFWALSNQLTEQAREESNQKTCLQASFTKARPSQADRSSTPSSPSRGGEVLDQAAQRLEFFRQQLAYSPSFSQGRDFLSATYTDFIPRVGDFADIPETDSKSTAEHKKAAKTQNPPSSAPRTRTRRVQETEPQEQPAS